MDEPLEVQCSIVPAIHYPSLQDRTHERGELYKQFVEQRDNDADRENLRTEMREWIRTRPARKTEE